MGRERLAVGRAGEKEALKFLKKKGYRIVAVNFRTPFGEIDAIARHRGFITFIEIKTRLTDSLGPPSLSVTDIKKRHIIKNAFFWLKVRRLVYSNWRIDVVSVKLNCGHKIDSIEIIENAVVNDNY
jgi:putative endonuclease